MLINSYHRGRESYLFRLYYMTIFLHFINQLRQV